MVLDDVVQTSQAVAATRSRTAKVDLLAQLLARTSREEVVATTSFLSGSLPRGRVGVGYRSLRELPEPATEPTITVAEVDRWLAELAALEGSGSTAKRRDALRSLLARATADEQRYLTALLVGELRQGALDGVMLPAVAKAAGVDLDLVRRAAMLSGSTPTVAQAALLGGAEALEAIELEVLRPVQPMLAVSSPTVAEALTELVGAQGDPKDASDLPDRVEVAVECKIDGIRVQVHRDGDEVVVVTRSLDDITSRLPEIVDLARALPVDRVVLDGEAVALRPGGRPQPFQVTGARTGSRGDAAVLRERTPSRSTCSTCCTSTDAPCSTSRSPCDGPSCSASPPTRSSHRSPPRARRRRRSSSTAWSPTGTRVWWSRRSTVPMPRADAGPAGSR
ncbi:hypothetical protein GCM10025862_09180 [Arsenicicoccus piscis]|uniref:ATP-dependent DNA ligase family profile domain-containing protein n=1 Tax=Arsenicicoccus piscis TaxID=673954 RepID=A0ABQ6HKM8_9MICO|nr:hypothetical protein GCM10025862_09180 [Arsenicicoccus piscis]